MNDSMRFTASALAISLLILSGAAMPRLAAAANCLTITRTLEVGSRGDDVLQLQEFLYTNNNLSSKEYLTGYFGLVTERAVRSWQIDHKIVTKEDGPEEGAGIVGPRTRAALLKACDTTAGSGAWATNGPPSGSSSSAGQTASGNGSGSASASATTTFAHSLAGKCQPTPRPASACSGQWVGKLGSNGCLGSWSCISLPTSSASASSTASGSLPLQAVTSTTVSQTNGAPSIILVQGPASVTKGTSGVWRVQAVDPENGPLTFAVSWGDAASSTASSLAFTSASSSSHTYETVGGFSATFFVRDGAGNTAQASTDISVRAAASSTGSALQLITVPQDQPYGSYGGGVQGQPCYLEGQQSFTACPFLANCFQGGSYLTCRNGVWSDLQSAENDRAANLASVLVAADAVVKNLLAWIAR